MSMNLDIESFKLLGKRAKLDSTKDTKLPLLINEDWGSDVLKQAYKDRLMGKKEKDKEDTQDDKSI
jgi:hypothetical protein